MLVEPGRSGSLINSGAADVTLDLHGVEPLSCPSLLLGTTQPNGQTTFRGVVVSRDEGHGQFRRVHAAHGGIADRLLSQDGREPLLDLSEFRYRSAFAPDVYQSWVSAGVLKPCVLDRVLVCPKCQSIPTIRYACRSCGSGRLERKVLVHHFACAHVAPLEQFDQAGSLRCPKCQTRHLIAGTDFEYAPGEHVCMDCQRQDQEVEPAGHCLNCDARFPLHKAVEHELLGYDADQLAALALVPELG